MNNNNYGEMDGLCQVPKIMYNISYAFNITWLIVIIVKDYLSGFMSIYVCFPRCSNTSDRAFYSRVLLIFWSIPIKVAPIIRSIIGNTHYQLDF